MQFYFLKKNRKKIISSHTTENPLKTCATGLHVYTNELRIQNEWLCTDSLCSHRWQHEIVIFCESCATIEAEEKPIWSNEFPYLFSCEKFKCSAHVRHRISLYSIHSDSECTKLNTKLDRSEWWIKWDASNGWVARTVYTQTMIDGISASSDTQSNIFNIFVRDTPCLVFGFGRTRIPRVSRANIDSEITKWNVWRGHNVDEWTVCGQIRLAYLLHSRRN